MKLKRCFATLVLLGLSLAAPAARAQFWWSYECGNEGVHIAGLAFRQVQADCDIVLSELENGSYGRYEIYFGPSYENEEGVETVKNVVRTIREAALLQADGGFRGFDCAPYYGCIQYPAAKAFADKANGLIHTCPKFWTLPISEPSAVQWDAMDETIAHELSHLLVGAVDRTEGFTVPLATIRWAQQNPQLAPSNSYSIGGFIASAGKSSLPVPEGVVMSVNSCNDTRCLKYPGCPKSSLGGQRSAVPALFLATFIAGPLLTIAIRRRRRFFPLT